MITSLNVLKNDVYDADILVKYTREEIEILNDIIDHDRDFILYICWIETG